MWLPHQFSIDNKIQRVTICSVIVQVRQTFFRQIVIGDEKWILYSNSHNLHVILHDDNVIERISLLLRFIFGLTKYEYSALYIHTVMLNLFVCQKCK